MTKRSVALSLLLLISFALTGCWFQQPLTQSPSKDLNTWLLGVWEHKNDEGEVYRVAFLPMTRDRYTVWFRELGKTPSKSKSWQFEAWISRVGNGNFLTLKCLQSPGDIPVDGYLFYHYQLLNQNNVKFRPLALDAAQDASSYTIRKEIRQKLKDQSLYPNGGTQWRRISEVYWDTEGVEQPMQPLRNPTL